MRSTTHRTLYLVFAVVCLALLPQLVVAQSILIDDGVDQTSYEADGATTNLAVNSGTAGITIAGATTLGSTLGVTGATTLAGLTAAATTLDSLDVTNDATIGGTLGVTGATTLAGLTAGTSALGDTTVTGTFTASGVSTLNGGVVVNGTSTLNGNTTVTGTFGVTGNSTFTGNATVTGNLSVNSGRINGAGGSSLVLNGSNATFSGPSGHSVKLQNIADGTSDSDAVNYGQMSSGLAAVAALAGIPGPVAGKNSSVGLGVASNGGQTALAVGAQFAMPEKFMSIGVGVGFCDSKTTVNGGISFGF